MKGSLEVDERKIEKNSELNDESGRLKKSPIQRLHSHLECGL